MPPRVLAPVLLVVAALGCHPTQLTHGAAALLVTPTEADFGPVALGEAQEREL